jgi:hypothetical protein
MLSSPVRVRPKGPHAAWVERGRSLLKPRAVRRKDGDDGSAVSEDSKRDRRRSCLFRVLLGTLAVASLFLLRTGCNTPEGRMADCEKYGGEYFAATHLEGCRIKRASGQTHKLTCPWGFPNESKNPDGISCTTGVFLGCSVVQMGANSSRPRPHHYNYGRRVRSNSRSF